MIRPVVSTTVLLLLWIGLPAAAPVPSAAPAERFDLVLVGDGLSPNAHTVALKTNPSRDATWTSLDGARCSSPTGVLVVPGLATARYYGQDLRENHLSIRITTTVDTAEGRLRAIYALPPANDWTDAACTRLARLTRTEPQVLRRHSLAAYERPRPADLRTDRPFIDHVEAPVRHRKPGEREVEWLNVLLP